METTSLSRTNIFTGEMDQDSDLHLVDPRDYRSSLNLVSDHRAPDGAKVPVEGNRLIPFPDLPSGLNTEIGSVENRVRNSIIYFVHNSLDEHTILEFESLTETIYELARGEHLNFDLNNRIHSAKVVDGKLLYWTDGKVYRDSIEGNRPRKLNIDKARTQGKFLIHELHFGDDSFTDGAEYSIVVTDLDGNIITPFQIIYTVSAPNDNRDDVFSGLAAALGAIDIDVSESGEKLVLTHQDPERVISMDGLTGGGVDNYILLVARNYYPPFVGEDMWLNLHKQFPPFPAKPYYVVDADVLDNNVYGKSFQFRYRYRFDDGETSAWGPASWVPTNFVEISGAATNLEADNSELYSKIEIDFSDPYLNSADWRSLIVGIDLAVKYTDEGIWRLVDTIPCENLGVNTVRYEFLNNGKYAAVPSDSSGAADIQALKNFDFVPRIAASAESVFDSNGNLVMAWSGLLEGYDLPIPRANLSVELDAADASPYPNRQGSVFKSLKSGGVYRVGVVYEDDYIQSPVLPLGRVRVPFFQLLTTKYRLEVEFLTRPPVWAKRYRIVVSENENQEIYIQVPAWEVTYWIYNPTEDTAVATNYTAGDATHVGFNLNPNDLSATFRNQIFEQLASNDKFFIPQPGDRVQLLNWAVGGGPPFLDELGYPIAGYNLTDVTDTRTVDIITIFIEWDPSQPDFTTAPLPTDWYFLEIFRKRGQVEDTLYYEFGEGYDVQFPGDAAKISHGPPVDLSNYGDTYISYAEFTHNLSGGGPYTVNIPNTQRPNLHRLTNEVLSDLGRPTVEDPDYKESFRWELIRFSDIFVPDSLVNGLSSFRGGNYIKTHRDFGSNIKLAFVQRVLLAICQYKTQPIYVGENFVVDLSGNSLVGRSGTLFNTGPTPMYDLGTHHPDTVVVENGKCYAFDSYNGTVWRYTTGGGQVVITRKMEQYFLQKGRTLHNPDSPFTLVAGFYREYQLYVLSFTHDTIAFQDNMANGEPDKWLTMFSFVPACYGRVGLKFVSFVLGLPWVHDDVINRCQFYEVNYDVQIQPVINEFPLSLKVFHSIVVQSTRKWFLPQISIPETNQYPGGMTSQIPVNRMVEYEGQYKASFMRDQGDPSARFQAIVDFPTRLATALLQGRYLRGEAMLITLELENPQQYAILRSITVYFNRSEATT